MFRTFLSILVCVFMFSILHVTQLVDSHPNLHADTDQARKYNGIVHDMGIIEKGRFVQT